MLNPEKDAPTHTGWCQRREKGQFREWYKRGHLWLQTDAQGSTVVCTFEGIGGPRGFDGFTWWYPNGVQPPDPAPEPQRPDNAGE